MDAQSKIIEFRDQLLHRDREDQIAVREPDRRGYKAYSYKLIRAQAHCLASWLMRNGFHPGETAAIFSVNSVFALICEIGFNILGIKTLIIPFDSSARDIENAIRQHKIRIVFFNGGDRTDLASLFDSSRPFLKRFVINHEITDEMDPDKLSEFIRIMDQGKVMWREHAGELEDLKRKVEAGTAVISEDGNKEIHYGNWISLIKESASKMKEAPVLAVHRPENTTCRACGWYAPMFNGSELYTLSEKQFSLESTKEINPRVVVADAAFLQVMKDQFYMAGKTEWKQKMDKAIQTYEKVDMLEMGQKKVPFLLRMRYQRMKKNLLSRLRKKAGNDFKVILCQSGIIDPGVRQFFKHLEVEIREESFI